MLHSKELTTCLPGKVGKSGTKTHWILVVAKSEGNYFYPACKNYSTTTTSGNTQVNNLSYEPLEITCSLCSKLTPPDIFNKQVIDILKGKKQQQERIGEDTKKAKEEDLYTITNCTSECYQKYYFLALEACGNPDCDLTDEYGENRSKPDFNINGWYDAEQDYVKGVSRWSDVSIPVPIKSFSFWYTYTCQMLLKVSNVLIKLLPQITPTDDETIDKLFWRLLFNVCDWREYSLESGFMLYNHQPKRGWSAILKLPYQLNQFLEGLKEHPEYPETI